jgi:hypothetical protein
MELTFLVHIRAEELLTSGGEQFSVLIKMLVEAIFFACATESDVVMPMFIGGGVGRDSVTQGDGRISDRDGGNASG